MKSGSPPGAWDRPARLKGERLLERLETGRTAGLVSRNLWTAVAGITSLRVSADRSRKDRGRSYKHRIEQPFCA